ncbi:hypothetical protein MU582_14105 [Nocardioidaceae bacterium SCSIO 66511]|nr:hypothetical protein MU582_14105 [Nocardioidaceae bacterium SCSIO 66511]
MNLDPGSNDGARNRLLLKLLGGLVVTGILIGLVVGVLGTTVLKSMGLKDQPAPSPAPSEKTTEIIDGGDESDEPEPDDDEGNETDEPDDSETTSARPKSVLRATPNPAEPGEEITLSGKLAKAHNGVLQVQRREGGTWSDFPVTANLNSNGTFSTYILTSRTGTAAFRLLHEPTGRSTPIVKITIG